MHRSVDLLAEFRRVTPAALQPLIVDLFETITLYDVRATSARLTSPGVLELVVSAKKVRSDGAGNETEVPFDGLVDIGALDAKGNLLGLEKHEVKSGENRFTLKVKGDPAKAGIDPLGKLIDRDASDNVGDGGGEPAQAIAVKPSVGRSPRSPSSTPRNPARGHNRITSRSPTS